MDDDLQVLVDVFPGVPPPDEDAWQLVRQRMAAAAAAESQLGRERARRARRRRYVVWSAIVGSAAAVLIAGLLATNGATPPTPQTRHAGWRLVSSIGISYRSTIAVVAPSNLTCPTPSTCYVVTYQEVAVPRLQSGGAGPTHNEVSMPTSGEVTTDGGLTWRPLELPSGVRLDTGFSCPTATTCMVGAIPLAAAVGPAQRTQLFLATTDGGTTWTEQEVSILPDPGPDPALLTPGQDGTWMQLDCFNATTCLAFGLTPYGLAEQGGPTTHVTQTVVMRTDDGGKSWKTQDLPWEPTPSGGTAWSNAQPATFSCTSSQTCLGLASVMGGFSADSGRQPTYTLEWLTVDGGTTWTNSWVSRQTIAGEGRALTCVDPSHCLAIGKSSGTHSPSVVLRSDDGGSTWQSALLPTGTTTFVDSVSCSTSQDCWAAGYVQRGQGAAGVIFASTDGGVTWATQAVPSDVLAVSDMTCPTVTTCFAVATTPGTSGSAFGKTKLLVGSASSAAR